MWLWNVYCRAERGGKTGWSAFFWNIILGLNTVKSGKWWFYLGKATFSHLGPFTLHKLCSAWTQIILRYVRQDMCSTSGFPYLDSVFNETDRGDRCCRREMICDIIPIFLAVRPRIKLCRTAATAARQDPSSGIIPICSGRGGQHITSSQPPRCRATGTSNTQGNIKLRL